MALEAYVLVSMGAQQRGNLADWLNSTEEQADTSHCSPFLARNFSQQRAFIGDSHTGVPCSLTLNVNERSTLAGWPWDVATKVWDSESSGVHMLFCFSALKFS